MNVLIRAPHPDDETIGMGGTINKLNKLGHKIFLCIISNGASNKDGDKKKSKTRKDDCKKVGKFLGVTKIIFLDFPDTRLMEIPQVEINSSIEDIIKKTNPEMLFIPPENDLHTDHSKVHNCALVASRSLTNQIKQIYSYEILGHVKTPFLPNVFIDIEKFLSKKITAFKMYKSEQKEFPHHRSIKSIENLAIRRGVESGLKFAEAFRLIRAMNSF